jgi:hypothetical protein
MCYSRDGFRKCLDRYNLDNRDKELINNYFLILYDLAKSKNKFICANPSFLITILYRIINPQVQLELLDNSIMIRFHKKYEQQLKPLFDELGWNYNSTNYAIQ